MTETNKQFHLLVRHFHNHDHQWESPPKESRHDCSSPLTVIINQVHKDPIHNYTDFPWHAFDALTLMHNLYNHTQLRQNATA